MKNGIFLGLGSNLGDRYGNLSTALNLLAQQGVEVVAASHVHETPPWGNEDQPAFLNQVIQVVYKGTPLQLLDLILEVENRLGRVRAVHWGPRVIDIDLLAFEAVVMVGQRLSIPHPLLSRRAFVLVPWAEIAADFVVAGTGKTVAEMLDALPQEDRSAIHRFTPAS